MGWNIISQPHLPIMPLLCDLADADWIPFNEQELQNAINQNIPYLRGIGFALIDIEWGYGAKFSLISKPEYHDGTAQQNPLQGEAFISITPSPDGTFMTLMVDLARTQSNPNIHPKLIQIATCELMPLFLNSLQQVQNRYVAPSQAIQQMVVMDSSLMIQFSPLTEITPEPAPEIVMNYDTSCLPSVDPTPTPPPLEGGMGLITIPPLEGEIGLLDTPIESNITLSQANDLSWGTLIPCNPGDQGWCAMLQVSDVFTYIDYNDINSPELVSINRTNQGIIEFKHELLASMTTPSNPSWGKVDNTENPNHYRLAFLCTVAISGTSYQNIPCYWDSNTRDYHFYQTTPSVNTQISPDGLKIAYSSSYEPNIIYIWNLETNVHTPIDLQSGTIAGFRWSDSNIFYYIALAGPTSYYILYSYNLATGAKISSGLDIPNLKPYIFDVHLGRLLFWSEYIGNPSHQRNSLNFFPPLDQISYSSGAYSIYWSPRSDTDNLAIIIDYQLNQSTNIIEGCIILDNYAVLDVDTGNEIICKNMGLGYSDWASGIDLSVFTSPATEQFTCLNPDPNATTADKINLCISELAGYGIIAYADGLPTTLPYACATWVLGSQYSQPWKLEELQQILMGVQDTAKAFYMVEYGIYASSAEAQNLTGSTDGEKAIFKNVIKPVPLCNSAPLEGFYILRVNSSFKYKPVDPQNPNEERDDCEGSSFEACTSNANHTIAFYETFYREIDGENELAKHDLIKYIFVHELGHRFNNQTDANSLDIDTSLKNVYLDNTGQTTIRDCNKLIVMGQDGPDSWTRGARGWGDVVEPNVLPSEPGMKFQQHPLFEDFKGTDEVDEATADMFLNWVYRRITDKWSNPINDSACGVPSFNSSDWSPSPETPETSPDRAWEILEARLDWEGFRNIAPDWDNGAYNYDVTIYDFDRDFNTPGEPVLVDRASLSGNARYWWMDNVMRAIFSLDMNSSWR
ncbi:MAG: hypothetical protein SFZ02_00250 [bacterium]|nr:hypothetical protein [bacterium]